MRVPVLHLICHEIAFYMDRMPYNGLAVRPGMVTLVGGQIPDGDSIMICGGCGGLLVNDWSELSPVVPRQEGAM